MALNLRANTIHQPMQTSSAVILALVFLLVFLSFFSLRDWFYAPAAKPWQMSQSYLLPLDGPLTIDAVSQLPPSSFTPFGRYSGLGPQNHSVWLRLQLKNPHNYDVRRVFSSENYQVHDARAYEMTTDGYRFIYDKNSQESQDKFLANESHLAFVFDMKPYENKVLYLQYSSYFYSHLHIQYQSVTDYLIAQGIRQNATMVMVALMFFIGFINFLFYHALRESYHLLYLSQQGLSIALVLADYGVFGSDGRISMVLAQLTVANGLLFTSSFLGLKQHFYRVHQGLLVLVWLLFLTLPVSFFAGEMSAVIGLILTTFILVVMIIPLICALRLYRRGLDYTLPFIVGGVLINICVVLFVLPVLDVVVFEQVLHYLMFYSALLSEALLLFVAISIKIDEARCKQQRYHQSLQQVYRQQVSEAGELERQVLKIQQQDQQLADTSHDIHHHLYLMRLNLANLSGEQQTVDSLKQSIGYLQQVTEQILVSNRASFEQRQSIDLYDFVYSLGQTMDLKLMDRAIKLRIRCPQGLTFYGSDVLLRRVMENLVNNAINHTHQGGVLIAVRRRKKGLMLAVYDTGSGISPVQLQQLFEMFKQGEAGLSEGYGLGLHIAATLCQHAGFELKVKSVKGRGSVFYVMLPQPLGDYKSMKWV